jgi:hypothetical protein
MSAVYKVVFEKYSNKFRITGIADSHAKIGKLCGSSAAGGIDHSAYVIDYTLDSALSSNTCYVVYVKTLSRATQLDIDYDLILATGETLPTTSDLYIFNSELDAASKVVELNTVFDSNSVIDRRAISVTMELNQVYSSGHVEPNIPEGELKEFVLFRSLNMYEEIPTE